MKLMDSETHYHCTPWSGSMARAKMCMLYEEILNKDYWLTMVTFASNASCITRNVSCEKCNKIASMILHDRALLEQ